MKKGYWVSQVSNIKDQELFLKYVDATAPLVERGDYKFICGGPVQATVEGDLYPLMSNLRYIKELVALPRDMKGEQHGK